MSALKYYDTTTGTWKYLAQGVKGDKGDTGVTGTTGATGATGPANTLTATAVSGAIASATITGAAPNQQLNLVLPTGQGYTARGVYSAGTTYAPYDSVYYNGSTYACILASTGNAPSNATYWQIMANGFNAPVGAYSRFDTYSVGDLVAQSGNIYYCINSVTGAAPPNASFWALLGYSIPSGGTTGQVLAKNSSTNYDAGWKTISSDAAIKAKFESFLANVNGPVKAIPAAVTPSGGYTLSTTAISGATVYAYNSGKFTFRGLTPTVITNTPGTSYYRNNANMNPSDPTPALTFNQFWVEFDYYGENFDIRYNNNQATYSGVSYAGFAQIWIWVDGVPTTETALVPTGGYVSSSYNTDRVLNVNFGSGNTKQRRIRILFGGLDFGGIGVKSVTETIFPVNQQLLKVAFIDGSWFAGTNGSNNDPTTATNLARQLAVQYGEMLNVDYYNLSIQSTGYVKGGNVDPILQTVTSAGNGDNWCSPARLDLITAIQPDLVVLLGTTNDDTFTGGSYQLGAHATYVYDGIASRAPNAKIIVFTRQSNTFTSSTLALNASTVYAAATAHPSVIPGGVVNIYNEGWITGTMNTGSGSGTPGNGQVFIFTDDHPNVAGNRYYATRMFDRTYDIIKSYARS